MKKILVFVFIAFFSYASASSVVGSVELVKGNAKVKSENSFKKSKLSVGLEI